LNLLRTDNDNLKRTNEILLHAGQTSKSSISEALRLTTSLSLEMSDINMKIVTLTERNVHLEREVDAHKSSERKLIGIIEEMENPTAFGAMLNEIWAIGVPMMLATVFAWAIAVLAYGKFMAPATRAKALNGS